MEQLSIQDLRQLVAVHGIDIKGLLEKQEIVEKVTTELAKKFGITEEKVHEHLAQAPAASSAASSVGDASAASAPAGGNAVDFDRTDALVTDLVQMLHERLPNEMLGQWQACRDGVGEWCFTTEGQDGPPLFYPFMAKRSVTLAFRCIRWKQDSVRLDPWEVLCWSPDGYVWPYCMFCRKWCYPYNEKNCHRASEKHRKNVARWREGEDMVQAVLVQQPRVRFYMLMK